VRRLAVGMRTRSWAAASRLFVVGDRGGWSVDEDAEHVAAAARRLGYDVAPPSWAPFVAQQAVFQASHFEALLGRQLASGHRLGLAYMHGRPGTPGAPEFDAAFEALRRDPGRVDRVQVTHGEMHDLVLSAGVADQRVFRIPLGIDIEHFPLGGEDAQARARDAIGVPLAAFVVGSFQKDGVGWGDGLEPKLIKGPDVLLDAAEQLRERVPELTFLLTGPSRGYVRTGLERLGIPHRHVLLPDVDAVAQAYAAIDVCVVSARDEGGPRAVLESMATGVPLVSTRVGQAVDLVRDGENGWLVDVEDVDALVDRTAHVAGASAAELERMREAGRTTAEESSYLALRPRWRGLLTGFVALPGPPE
jgi:glycosyltransferase involved in cell wall biosynthesis